MYLRLFSLLLILLLAIPSCTFRRSNPRLMEIECKLDSFPEEMWQRLNTPEVTNSLSSRAERMYCALLRAEAMNKTMRYMDTLHFDEVNDYFQRYGDANYRMRSIYIKGCIYRDKGDAPMAIQYYRDAVNSADTASADCDFLTLSRIYGQIALLYDQQRLPRKTLEALRMAAHYCDRTTDTVSSIQYRQFRGRAFLDLHKEDSACYCYVQAIEAFKKLGIRRYIASSQCYFILPSIRKGDYAKAKELIDEYIAHSELFDAGGRINPYCTDFLAYLGVYYCAIGKPDSAIYYYRQLFGYTRDIRNIAIGYEGLLDAYEMKHQPDSMVKYARLYAAANDSSNKAHAADEVVRMEATYNYAEHHRIAAEKTQEVEQMWRVLLLSLAFVAVGTVMAWSVYRRSRRRHKALAEERKRVMAEYASVFERLQTAEEELYASRHHFEHFIADKEEEIARLRTMLAEARSARLVYDEGEAALLASDIVQRLHRTSANATEMSTGEWKKLQDAVQRLLPDFYKLAATLRKHLTDQEYMLLLLTRCQFSHYEIRTLMSTSAQRFTNLRTSVNRKLFDEQGARTLTQHIMDMPASLKV